MKKAICNSSPIISLSRIGKQNLLWENFEIIIPRAVYDEIVTEAKEDKSGKHELIKAIEMNYIRIMDIKDKEFVEKTYGHFHRGELEVIVLAKELNIDTVIIDEKSARTLAKSFLLRPIGIIGILILSKKKRLINSIKPYLDELRRNKYRISDKLYFEILNNEGEI